MLFQNIRSFKNKRNILEATLDNDKTLKIICLIETWITEEKRDLLILQGYTCATSYCRQWHEGGGVCIFLEEEIIFKERHDISNMSVELIFEVCGIEIPSLNILIVVLYWPEINRNPDIFYNSLEKLLKIINLKNGKNKLLIGGDFNINVMKTSTQTQQLLELMNQFNFKQLVTQPTRITNTTSTCIDLLFSNFQTHKTNIKHTRIWIL